MKKIEWITGLMSAGKTTYIERLIAAMARDNEKTPHVLYVGKICREKFGAGLMAKDPNAAAPEFTEAFVRELVTNAVNQMDKHDTLIVDGMPRKPSQVHWIKDNFDTVDFRLQVRYLFCEDQIRRERAKLRDIGNAENTALNLARLDQESTVFRRVLEELLFLGIPVAVIDTTPDARMNEWKDLSDSEAVEAVKYIDTNLFNMFRKHTEFSNMVMGNMGVSMEELYKETHGRDTLPQMHRSVEWARKFVHKAQGELAELLRELPDNWWSKDTVDLRASRVELIDAWHFMISASMALGMGPPDFVATFYDKLNINIERQRVGYSKANKVGRDDEHVGRQEPPVVMRGLATGDGHVNNNVL